VQCRRDVPGLEHYLQRAEPPAPSMPLALTTLIPRTRLSISGAAGEYLSHDDVDITSIRARLRLCVTDLVEHAIAQSRVAIVVFVAAYESVNHVFFECDELLIAAARDALRAVALDLDVSSIAGIFAGPAEQRPVAFAASASLLRAARKLLRL